jgi:hypothetical protein
LSLAFSLAAPAADNGAPTPGVAAPSQWRNRMMGKVDGEPGRPEFENVRRAMESLTPEQRQRFKENLVRWMNLPPDEKRALRDREEQRREKVAVEIDAAVKESGLILTPLQREQFARRYSEERLHVEQRLRQEMEEKRKPLVRDIIARLKNEFSASGALSSGAPSTPASGTTTIQTVAPR